MSEKTGLSSSEWSTAIKMIGQVAPVRSLPGRSQDGSLCRHGCKEAETLGHILGVCPKSQLLRNNRHHVIRSKIANALKQKGWSIQEEITCNFSGGSIGRVDILAIKESTKEGFIFDPTVRLESSNDQPEQVHREKKTIMIGVLHILWKSSILNQ